MSVICVVSIVGHTLVDVVALPYSAKLLYSPVGVISVGLVVQFYPMTVKCCNPCSW